MQAVTRRGREGDFGGLYMGGQAISKPAERFAA